MWKLIVNDGETQHGPDWTWLDLKSHHALDKLASAQSYTPPSLLQKIDELQDTLPDGKVAFYNRALGSYEAFGLNRNGDGFDRAELMRKHSTFVENAHYFRHHQNRDTALSRGRPVASAFNEQTDMVDLIIVADMDKCAEQIEHVHKLASAPYGMRAVLSDGQICGVKNPNPKFFDISDVVIGAAPESETLLKVASFGGGMGGAELAEILGLAKMAGDIGEGKHAAITKRIPGHLEGNPIMRRGLSRMSSGEESMDPGVIDRAREIGGFDGVLRNSAALGIVLKPDEFSRAAKLGSFSPPTLREIRASEPMPKKILTAALDPEMMTLFSREYEKRSSFMPALMNRINKPQVKTASYIQDHGHEDSGAKSMYAAYRRSLIEELPDVGGREGEYWVMKTASTNSRMFGDFSRSYLASAFLSDSEELLDKALDRVSKIAEPSYVTDFGNVTSTVAEKLGIETLDSIAVQSLRKEANSKAR